MSFVKCVYNYLDIVAMIFIKPTQERYFKIAKQIKPKNGRFFDAIRFLNQIFLFLQFSIVIIAIKDMLKFYMRKNFMFACRFMSSNVLSRIKSKLSILPRSIINVANFRLWCVSIDRNFKNFFYIVCFTSSVFIILTSNYLSDKSQNF